MAVAPPLTSRGSMQSSGHGSGCAFRSAPAFGTPVHALREGRYTEEIYGLIRDLNYSEAISILQLKLLAFPSSRAALSLLGYCQYHTHAFVPAIQTYGELVRVCPQADEYKMYYAQVLFKAGMYDAALKVCE